MATIAIHGLCKSYGKTEVLRDIDLTFEEGRIYGLLGRNGVGKSTRLNLITRRIFPDRGEIAVDGVPVGGPGDPLRKIYCMSEAALYPENMRVAELYRWTADFYPHFDRARADRLTAAFGLDPKKRIKSLSTGYASIVKLIVTLSSGAEVLIFDEPVLGLDAGHRSLFYKEVLSLYGEKGCTVVLSTHIIEEISDLLESVIILEDCRVLASESVDGLLERYHCVSGAEGEVMGYLSGREVVHTERMGPYLSATVAGPADREQADRLNLTLMRPKLQDLFIHLTQGKGGTL